MPNQALRQTAGHDSFLGLQARRCPAAAELWRSTNGTRSMTSLDAKLIARIATVLRLVGFGKLVLGVMLAEKGSGTDYAQHPEGRSGNR